MQGETECVDIVRVEDADVSTIVIEWMCHTIIKMQLSTEQARDIKKSRMSDACDVDPGDAVDVGVIFRSSAFYELLTRITIDHHHRQHGGQTRGQKRVHSDAIKQKIIKEIRISFTGKLQRKGMSYYRTFQSTLHNKIRNSQ